MGKLTVRDDDKIYVPDKFSGYFRSVLNKERFYGKNLVMSALPNCPECVAREAKKLKTKYEMEAEEADNEGKDYLIPSDRDIISDIEFPMKLDPSTKHFICKRCGLYATREQVNDIRQRLQQRESTKVDRQYDYLDWWQKSKKEKAQ